MNAGWGQGLDALIRRMGNGDVSAFEAFIAETQLPVQKLMFKITPTLSEDEAAAITNQVYANTWFGSQSYNGGSDLVARIWLNTIIRNATMGYFRKMKRHFETIVLEADMPVPNGLDKNDMLNTPLDQFTTSAFSDEALPTEDLIARKQGIEGFKSMLDSKETIIFKMLAEGYPNIDIAAKLGITPSAVSQRIRAMKKKARHYQETG